MNNGERLQDLISIANAAGFDKCAPVASEQIVFDTEFRKLCEINTCRNYGLNYMCPPHIGGADECIAKVKEYAGGLIVQSIVQLEDSFDYDGMMSGQKTHDIRIKKTVQNLKGDKKYFFLGAGPCSLCGICGSRDKLPCRSPLRAISSMEAHCIDVNKTITNAGLKYNNGEATMSYVGLVML